MTEQLSAKEFDDLLDALIKEEYQDKEDNGASAEVEKNKDFFNEGYKQGYQKGLDKAWEAAKYIAFLAGDDVKRRKIIGDCAAWYAFTHYTASEVIDKIEVYEQKQNEIKVGDEVYLIDKNHPRVVTCITKIDGENLAAVQFTESGKWAVDSVTELHKTGRHFDQIEEVLKALGEN